MTEKDANPLLAGEAAFKRLTEYAQDQEMRWMVAWSDRLIVPRDPNAPPPSLATRIRWRLRGLAYKIEDAEHNVRARIADGLRKLADHIEY